MSELREQLRSFRAGYEAMRYPGDLAADVLPANRLPLYASWSAIAAIAAIVAVVLLLNVQRPRTDSVPIAPVQSVVADSGLRPIPPLPEIPTGVSLVPPSMQEYGALAPVPPPYQSFSLPPFPSFPTNSN